MTTAAIIVQSVEAERFAHSMNGYEVVIRCFVPNEQVSKMKEILMANPVTRGQLYLSDDPPPECIVSNPGGPVTYSIVNDREALEATPSTPLAGTW